MQNQVKVNKKKIDTLFKKSLEGVNHSCVDGMTKLLEAGVKYCLGAHDQKHHRHLEMGDSYGWVLLKDGRELKRKLYAEGAEAQGNASTALNEVSKSNAVRTSGYTGIVLAGMHPITYFNVRFEFYAMRQGMKELSAEDFQTIFKPVRL